MMHMIYIWKSSIRILFFQTSPFIFSSPTLTFSPSCSLALSTISSAHYADVSNTSPLFLVSSHSDSTSPYAASSLDLPFLSSHPDKKTQESMECLVSSVYARIYDFFYLGEESFGAVLSLDPADTCFFCNDMQINQKILRY